MLDTILDNMSQNDDFKTFYYNLSKTSSESLQREVYLRPSMLPTCSIHLFMALLFEKYKVKGSDSFFMNYFTSVGTIVHETIQNFHSKGVDENIKVWGNWHCDICGTKWEHSSKNICSSCGKPAIYDEIELAYGGFKGHIDCILLTPKGVLVCDYKTSTNYNTTKPFSQLNVAYSLQILTYCYMLSNVWGSHFKDKGYGKVIAGSLLFICRDNPNNTAIHSIAYNKATRKVIKKMLKHAEVQLEAARYDFQKNKIDKILETKCCKNKLDYLNNYSPFYKYAPCAYIEYCSNGSKLAEFIKDTLAIKVKYVK